MELRASSVMLLAMAGRFATWWSLRRQRLHAQRIARGPARVPLAIRLIATGKLLKAFGFIALGLYLARMIHAPDVASWTAQVMEHIHIDPDGTRAQRVLGWIANIPHHRLTQVAAGAFGYAVIYLLEGLGLWFDRYWAEWLTVVGTVVFIPFEVIHLVHKPSLGIAVVLILNIAIAVYLGLRLWRRCRRPTSSHQAG